MDTPEEEIEKLKARIREYEQNVQADQILRSIANNSPSNIALVDLDSRIQYINWTVPGITPDEIVGQKITDIVEKDDLPGIVGAFERVAKTGESDQYQVTYISPSGYTSLWESKVGPLIQNSKVTGFIVVSTDVTELRLKHEEQERFFNLSVDLMCVAGFDGYFKRVNQAFTTTLGYQQDELLNRPFYEFVHPDDQEDTAQVITRLIGGEVVIDSNNRYRAADGSYRYFSWRGIADLKREVIYAVARDITDTRNLEEQLQQSRRLEALGQLAGGIAHDFNNLLGIIQGNIELAQLTPKLTESSLRNALEGTSRAAALTKQLMVFSRHQNLSPEVIDVIPLLESLMDLLARLIPENIVISLAPKGKELFVFADKSQLEQVVVNLCVNARDAMPDGGKLNLSVEKVTIPSNSTKATFAKEGEYLKFTVADTGHGMTPEVQSHIFEPFFTTKEVGKGSGLGLATVYAIVKQHNGFTEVDSKINQGTTLKIYLPAAHQDLPDTLQPSDAPATAKGGHETILLAEDDPMVRDTVTLMLDQAGYNIIKANDGLEAVRLFKENANKISLVLLDVVMPNLGGLDAAEQLRQQKPNLKILFTSGHLQNNQDPKRLENETLLSKPYQMESLLACIREKLDSTD